MAVMLAAALAADVFNFVINLFRYSCADLNLNQPPSTVLLVYQRNMKDLGLKAVTPEVGELFPRTHHSA